MGLGFLGLSVRQGKIDRKCWVINGKQYHKFVAVDLTVEDLSWKWIASIEMNIFSRGVGFIYQFVYDGVNKALITVEHAVGTL